MKQVFYLGMAITCLSVIGNAQVAMDGVLAAKVTNTTPGMFEPDTGFDTGNNLIPVTGGGNVTCSFWARSGNVVPSQTLRAGLAFFEGMAPEGHGSGHLGDFNVVGNQNIPLEWRKYSGTFTVPATANYCVVGFRVDGGGNPPHSIVIDDVTITDNTTVPPTLIPVLNQSFEIWAGAETDPPTDWRYFHVLAATGSIMRVENPPAAESASEVLLANFKRDAVEIPTTSNDWFTTDANTRGMAYNPLTDHLLVVDRESNTVGSIRVLDAATGADIGQLNTTGIDAAGSTFIMNKVGVDASGRIFVANLARTNQTLKIYMYANEAAALVSGPAVVYSLNVTALHGGRFGDDMDVTGSGASTRIVISGRGPDRILALEDPDNDGMFTGIDYSVPGLNGASNVAFTTDPDVFTWHRSLGFFNTVQIPDYPNVSSPVLSINYSDGTPAGPDPYGLNTPHATGPFDIAQLVATPQTLLAIAPAEAEYTTATVDVAGYGYDFTDNSSIPFRTGGLEMTGGYVPNGNGTGDVIIDPVGNRVFYLVTSNSISSWELPDVTRVDEWMLF